MVPRQFVALLEQRKQEHVRQEFGPAIIVSAIHSLFSKKRPDPTKFMPSYDRSEADDEMPWQEQMAKLGAAVSAVGG